MSLPTYYLVCFHEEATQECVNFVADCLKKDLSEGGAELTVRQEDMTENKNGGLVLHVSATPERLYSIAESIDLKLKGEWIYMYTKSYPTKYSACPEFWLLHFGKSQKDT